MESPSTIHKPSTTALVETVNINVEDFSYEFLTCSTCLYTFDQNTRKPKLLPCSHSVCLFCVTQLAALSAETEPPSLRCPLCREVCLLPSGGVATFPAAFYINQLLDVMQKQRKDVVPSCTNHPSDQLLYCETCDLVFCEQCQTSIVNKKCDVHTVVPLSIAIKRMSEIVVYRAKGRLRALDDARLAVNHEIEELDQNVDKIVEQINTAIQEVSNLVENRRRELIETVRVRRDEKRKVLKDQIEVIQDEKKKLEKELESCKLDIRAMARKLKDGDVDENWQRQIIEPRENAFLRINTDSSKMLLDVEKNLNDFGKLHASNTFPGTSTIEVPNQLGVHAESVVNLITRSVTGEPRTTGGDPITVTIQIVEIDAPKKPTNRFEMKDLQLIKPVEKPGIQVVDNGDGTYSMSFRTTHAGDYQIDVNIFGRPVKNSPLIVRVEDTHKFKWQLGVALSYPTKVWLDGSRMFILDSGNNRVRITKENGDVIADVKNETVFQSGTAVGLVYTGNDELAVLNWQTKTISKLNLKGEVLKAVSFSEFYQPIDLAVDSRGRFIIADSAKVFVFDNQLRPLFSFPVKETAEAVINCVGIGLDDDIIVGTSDEILLYDSAGKKLRNLNVSPVGSLMPKIGGRYAMHAVCCEPNGQIVVTFTDKKAHRTAIGVLSYKGDYQYSIEPNTEDHFQSPCGIFLHKDLIYIADNRAGHVRSFKYK